VIDNWIDFCLSDLEPAVCAWIYPILGLQEPDPEMTPKAQQHTRALLQHINGALASTGFLCGSQLTLADVSVFSTLVLPFRMVFDDAFLAEFEAFRTWFAGIAERAEVAGVWGKIHRCRVSHPVPEPRQKREKAPAKKPAQPKKKEEGKAKPEPKKKEEEKKAAAPAAAPAKKPQNPLELLPPSPFVMDTWKKLYSNNPVDYSMEEFWKIFDKEGWSLWKLRYDKLEDECTVVYMTNNQVKGFLQRMEAFRKWSFGYMGIYGDEPNLDIKGVFLWRGQEIAQELKDHPQFEYFSPQKLDPDSAETRALVNEYWSKTNEGDMVEGAKHQDGHVWK
jgi:elongation factor 1-gamma